MTDHRVGIVGAGLIGTSIGMALARSGARPALLADVDHARAVTAAALGAGLAVMERDPLDCEHVVVAVPPAAVATTLRRLQDLNVNGTFSDVASVKANVLADAEAIGADMSRFCAAHPIAGRERGGPTAAVPELFDDAVWVSTPTVHTSPRARTAVHELARRCGAKSLEMTPVEHDQALAVISHLPQFVASMLAGQLTDAGAHGPALAGRGFRDTTRLADSDPALWVQIALGNSSPLAAALTQHAAGTSALAAALVSGDAAAVRAVLVRGQQARVALPTKHQRTAVTWARLGVVLQDQPGELARLFAVAGDADVNIEDVTIDHATDHPVGLVVLDVAPDRAHVLAAAVRTAGWHALPIG